MAEKTDFQLREMEEKDLEMVLAWRNQPLIRANMYTDHSITLEEHQVWFSRIKKDSTSVYLICEQKGVPIGCVNFVQIDRKNKKAFWGFYLGEEVGAPGRGSIMEYLAVEYAFGLLRLRKLCAEVFSFNEKVLKLHSKFGFQVEGIYKQHVLKNDKFEDVVAIALFPEDWSLLKPKMEKICFRSRDKS